MGRNGYAHTKRSTRAQPTLVLVMGVAASGKTTLSKHILKDFRATYLDNNFVVDAFYPDTRMGTEYFKFRPNFYAVLYRITEENLVLGNSVLLDVPHIKEVQQSEWRTRIIKLTAETHAKLVVLRCICSEQTLKQRIIARGESRDAWKLDNWDDFLKEQPIAVPVPFDHFDINTESDVSANAELAIQYILRHH